MRNRPLKILHVVMALRATSTQYNEHCLPLAHQREIAICSFFKAAVSPPPEISLFEGTGTLRGFWRALRAAVDARTYDVIHAHAAPAGVLVIAMSLLRRRSLRNTVYTAHNSFQNFSLRNKLLLYPVFMFFPHIVLCSDAVLESLPSLLRWLAHKRISVVPNAVDTDRVDRVVSERKGRPRDAKFNVLSVARLIHRKNPLTLMTAFGANADPDSKLIYVGDGDLRPRLVEEADRMGLRDRVTFTGLISREEVYQRMVESDVYVTTSRGEGLPVAVLEAMACSRPVILSDIAPHREIAKDANFIPLIPPDDVDGFAREIKMLRRMSREQRSGIGEHCRELIEARFSLRAMHRSYERVYERAMGRSITPEGNLLVSREGVE